MIELKNVTKRYQFKKVLKDISMTLPDCGLIAIVGPSGCGKSTLLNIIGGLDHDFQGKIKWNGKSIKRRLRHYSQKHVSFIFQQFHLIPWLQVQQNISLSHYFYKRPVCDNCLDIESFQKVKIGALSLGQRQRVAYLRAYYQQCDVLLCDEPTGSLDEMNTKEVMTLLKQESLQRLVVIVSHDLKAVKQYSDLIYEMKDGCLFVSKSFENKTPIVTKSAKQRKKKCAALRLSLSSLRFYRKRSLQLIFGLTLALLCIVITFSLSNSLEKQIQNYVYSFLPPSSISFKPKKREAISLEIPNEFKRYPEVIKSHLYLRDYEFLGLGYGSKHYQEDDVLFIGDDSSPYQGLQLQHGRYPQAVHEIVLSLSTAKRLSHDKELSLLIDQNVNAWYRHKEQVKAITYKIVGITSQTTVMETIYQQENAYMTLLEGMYPSKNYDKVSMIGMIYLYPDKEPTTVLTQLQKDYSEYTFVQVGEKTMKSVKDVMAQVRIVFFIFSGLAILSSLFLVGEVMFLNVVQKRKDLAILICFGASRWQLLKIVFYESLEIIICAQCICTVLYMQLIRFINTLSQEFLSLEEALFGFDTELLVIVYGLSVLLVFVSQIPPLLYVLKLNPVTALKY